MSTITSNYNSYGHNNFLNYSKNLEEDSQLKEKNNQLISNRKEKIQQVVDECIKKCEGIVDVYV